MTGVYTIKNIKNNKYYIGSSVNIQSRLCGHKCSLNLNKHKNEHLQNSVNKYGLDSFVFTMLEECPEDELIEKEAYWINFYTALLPSKGYNIREAGNNGKVSKSTKLKLSKAHTGKKLSEEHKHKMSVSQKNRIRKNEKMSIAHMGNKLKGRKMSEEQKEQISRALKGRKCPEETKRKISEFYKNKRRTEEPTCKQPTMKKGGKRMKTVDEIAAMFNVSGVTVRRWVDNGLPYQKEKVIGRKTRIVIEPADVYNYHKSKEKKDE